MINIIKMLIIFVYMLIWFCDLLLLLVGIGRTIYQKYITFGIGCIATSIIVGIFLYLIHSNLVNYIW